MAEGLWTLGCQSKAPYYLEFPRNKTDRKYRERERDGCKERAHMITEADKSLDRQSEWASWRPRADRGAAA